MSKQISNPNVNVVCRFRPMNNLERTNGNEEVATFTSLNTLTFKSSKEKNTYKFAFDRIFPPSSTQTEVYEFGVKGIIESVLSGYNGTVLAYGQTASGKTYTMQGIVNDEQTMGIIPRMINHVFSFIYESPPENEFMVKVSMIEIYQEKIRDLIETEKVNLNVREDKTKGIFIEDVSEHYVGGPEEVINIMNIGTENRAQACTNMNEHSSRSHSIFIMTINQTNKKDGVAKTGKLYLVDLAGSEKISKTGATGHTLEEAKIINKSLTTLGMVINSLTDGKSTHIPYRESKLTRVLQESLGGNSKTCLIITCSPSVYNESESLSTLRFGERAKKIKNKPKINKEITVAELQLIVSNLETQLDKANRRIKQLEEFIIDKGFELPKGEDNETYAKKKKEREQLRNLDEGKLLEEFKLRNDNDTLTLTEKIISTINLLKESEEGNEDKTEVIGKLLLIKDNYEKKEIENQKQIMQLQSEVEILSKHKDRLQLELIEKETKEEEETAKMLRQSFKDVNAIQEVCFQYLNVLKHLPSVQNDEQAFQIVNDFFEKLANVVTERTSVQSKVSNDVNHSKSLSHMKQDNETQTEGIIVNDDVVFKNEIEKITKQYEHEKNVCFKALDDKAERVCQLENDLSDLEEKYNLLNSKIPFDAKQNIEKLLSFEHNLLELKRLLQQSQAEKLQYESNNRKMLKVLKSKCEIIEKLEKEMIELKERSMLRSTMMGNVKRVIKGGHIFGKSTLDSKGELGSVYMK